MRIMDMLLYVGSRAILLRRLRLSEEPTH